MVKSRKYVLKKPFEGTPKPSDFELVEENLRDELKENEVLLEVAYLSVDPYMVPFSKAYKPPVDMFGEQLSKVVKSRNPDFPVGTYVLAQAGWRTHYISDGKNIEKISFDLGNTSPSYCLGVLGMPGATAYFGFVKLLEPKAGEILVVNGAAGAVGSIVGQLAKIKGVTVIAFVGSEDKVNWAKNELGFDHVFNYKKIDISTAISQAAPNGVDLFFDNVGGDFFNTVVSKHLRKYGRATLCGSIETYNQLNPKTYPSINFPIVSKELRIQGIQIFTYKKDWPKAFVEIHEYIKQGKIKVQETVYNGFDSTLEGFFGLFKGENTGKAIIKA